MDTGVTGVCSSVSVTVFLHAQIVLFLVSKDLCKLTPESFGLHQYFWTISLLSGKISRLTMYISHLSFELRCCSREGSLY